MKHVQIFEQFLFENQKMSEGYVDKDWEKEGSRFRSIPFDEYKVRQAGKPEFKNGPFTPIEVEQYFTRIAGSMDGKLQAAILKGFDKYEDKFKDSGERWQEYKQWIIDAAVRDGWMVG